MNSAVHLDSLEPDTGRPGVWTLFAALSAVGVLLLSAGPLRDVDRYWHISIGSEILSYRSLDFPEPWSFVRRPPWRSSAWLSEVVFVAIDALLGDLGFRLLRLFVGGATLALLARVLLGRRPDVWGPLVFSVVALQLFPFIVERPQLFSLPLLIWLAVVSQRVLCAGRVPPWWQVALVTYLWANLHGLWVLTPVALTLAMLAVLLQSPTSARALVRPLAACVLAAFAVGTLTPAGPRLLLTPFLLRDAAQGVREWQPTSLTSPIAWGLLALLVLMFLGWARAREPIPVSEIVWTLAWAGFALLAVRNIPPATLLLAPVVLGRLQETFPGVSSSLRVPRSWVAAVLVSGGLGALAVVSLVPNLPRGTPLALVARLSDLNEPVRLLNDPNVGGLVIAYAEPQVKVAVDGRADRYGAAFLGEYRDLMNLKPGWQVTLASLHPTHAFLLDDVPLALRLEEDPQWTVLDRADGYVVLAAD